MTIGSLPKTRNEARSVGSRFYFTGRPCRHGHVDKRYAFSEMCHTCIRIATERVAIYRAAAKREDCVKAKPKLIKIRCVVA